MYLCTSELQSQLLTFRLNEEPHLMWDYRTSDSLSLRWSLFPVGFPWNIRLLKTSQAQFSSTRGKKIQGLVTLATRIKTLQTSSMVWCSSVRRFCFCSLRRTRTETRHEGWNVSFLISCFQGNQWKRWQWAKERESDRRSDKVGSYHSQRLERRLASVISIYWCFTEIQTVTAQQDRWIF